VRDRGAGSADDPPLIGEDAPVRIATYNIRHGAPAGRCSDLAGMQSAVASLDADVVALQEVDRHVVRSRFADQPRRLAEAAGLTPLFAAARGLGPIGRYGNALLVRGDPRRVATLRLHAVGESRVAVFAQVELDGVELTAVSTHLQNRRAGRPDEAPDQLRQVLDELGSWPRPHLLLGDLNLRADTVLPVLEAAGMTAIGSGPTFPADAPRLRIDWIAVAGLAEVGLRVGDVQVPDLRASDHRPIVAELVPVG